MDIVGSLKALDPSTCKEKGTGVGGTELVPLGCFQVKISFPLTCCVYQNLTSDKLMGSAYLKHVTPQHPLSVSQLLGGYVFNSLKYSQPSLTLQQAQGVIMR